MDESHIIYVNSSIQDDTELGRLAHDLHCKNADEMYSEILAKRVRELKETQKGVEKMCDVSAGGPSFYVSSNRRFSI